MEANGTAPSGGANKMKTVYTVTERGGRSFWTRIGVGFLNRDGSINLRLDAVPVSGTLQVRDYEPLDKRGSDDDQLGPRGASPLDAAARRAGVGDHEALS